MKQNLLKNNIMAILFASGDAFDEDKLAQVLETTTDNVEDAIAQLNKSLEKSPITIAKLEAAYQITTKAEYGDIIKKALVVKNNTPLSAAAMEVLAIIAYNQPVTRAFVDQIRGVDCGGVVSSLIKKDLVEEAGRLKLPGRPIAYKTTKNFLMCFGLDAISSLPKIPKEKDGQQIIEI
ncbi:MAG: SMC-Scp complex subunit ScpB [Oscillospiraceae bacterium]